MDVVRERATIDGVDAEAGLSASGDNGFRPDTEAEETEVGDDEGSMSTIGVSIPIPQPWREQLDNARIEAGDPNGGIVPAHVTLLGPTEVPESDLDFVERHLREVAERSHPFSLHLRGTGSFRPITEVVFVAVAEGISSCEQLAGRVRSKLLWRPLRFPYHPHVTIAHDVEPEALDAVFAKFAKFEAKFEVDSFTWYVHKADANNTEWLPQGTFALGAK